VDLVAHCGGRLQGGCLYTITLTDVATGWTECLPLLNRGREAVLAALQRARALFPFPILGLDTDLIITHKLTRKNQKEKLKGKETTKRKEASRWRPGPNKKSDTHTLEISA